MSGPTREEIRKKEEADKKMREEQDLSIREALLAKKVEEQAVLKKQLKEINSEKRSADSEEAWDAVGDKSDELSNAGMKGYDEWISAMMNIVIACKVTHRAVRLSWGDTFENVLELAWNQSGDKLVSKAKGSLQAKGIIKDAIEPLTYTLGIDEKGALSSTLIYKGKDLDPDQQQVFNTGIVAWLKINGCKYDSKTHIVTDASNKPLTPEALKKLNEDDEQGLEAFLTGRYNLNMSATPAP